jgi:hypothetical protein
LLTDEHRYLFEPSSTKGNSVFICGRWEKGWNHETNSSLV